MEPKKAVDFYTGRAGVRYNCAQAVAAAFSKDVGQFATCGGGNAPHGWCGAAHAAAVLTGDRHGIENLFTDLAGTVTCDGLRSGRKMSCLACVEKSAQFVKDKALVPTK